MPFDFVMEGPNQELSHDDVWDDSMLIDSWNEALEEYKVKKEKKNRNLSRALVPPHHLRFLQWR